MPDLNAFQDRIAYRFRDVALLRVALTHPSLAHERGGGLEHNQRLEFLGDAVLQLVLTDELFRKFPALDEGRLTKARAHMVNRRVLATQGRELRLNEELLLSRGEESTGGRDRPSAVADAFEALVGAVYQDGGFEAARGLVLRLFHKDFGDLEEIPSLENPKGELQELLQAGSTESPQYHLECVSGPDHDRLFECAVYHQGVKLGRGTGKSKKEAESRAALAALEQIRRPRETGA